MSYLDIVIHAGFCVKNRARRLDPSYDPSMRKCVAQTLRWNATHLIGFGAADDHVHLLMQLPARGCIEYLMRDIKSDLGTHLRELGCVGLRWGDGYWAFSVRPVGYEAVLNYVENQRVRHARGLSVENELATFRAVDARSSKRSKRRGTKRYGSKKRRSG